MHSIIFWVATFFLRVFYFLFFFTLPAPLISFVRIHSTDSTSIAVAKQLKQNSYYFFVRSYMEEKSMGVRPKFVKNIGEYCFVWKKEQLVWKVWIANTIHFLIWIQFRIEIKYKDWFNCNILLAFLYNFLHVECKRWSCFYSRFDLEGKKLSVRLYFIVMIEGARSLKHQTWTLRTAHPTIDIWGKKIDEIQKSTI